MRWAAEQATLTGSALRAVASWRWPNYLTRLPPGADLAAETSEVLHKIVESVTGEHPDLAASEVVVEGPPGPALVSQAGNAVLLVVGARGRATFPGMLLGSVAEYCVRHGDCPVVVVRTDRLRQDEHTDGAPAE